MITVKERLLAHQAELQARLQSTLEQVEERASRLREQATAPITRQLEEIQRRLAALPQTDGESAEESEVPSDGEEK